MQCHQIGLVLVDCAQTDYETPEEAKTHGQAETENSSRKEIIDK